MIRRARVGAVRARGHVQLHELGQRAGPELVHQVAAMDFDRRFGEAEFGGDALVEPAGDDAVEHGPLAFTELREPLAREIEEAGGSNIALIAIISAIPRKAAEQLHGRDYMEAVGHLNSFLTDSPETGES